MKASSVPMQITADSDRDLVTRHRYGDEGAFEELYQRYGGMIYNVALRLSGDSEEALDLSQETLLKIHRHLSGFGGRSSLRTWIYRVTVNCCRSRFRRRSFGTNRPPDDAEARLARLPDRRRDPEQRAIATDIGSRIEQALAQLPRIYREVVVLRDLEELSYREIARILGVRHGTVRSRIARGRSQLRDLLEDLK